MVKKSKAAGQFLGGIFNNPAFVILGLGLGAIFLFRKDIRGAFSGLSEGLVNIKFPELPAFPDIKFPDIKFPDITFPELPAFPDFSDIFGGLQKQIEDISGQLFELQGQQGQFGEDTTITKEGVIEGKPPTIDLDLGEGFSNIDPLGEIAFNLLRSETITSLIQGGADQFKVFEAFADISFFDSDKPFKALDEILQSFNTPFTPPTPPDTPTNDLGFGTTVIQSLGTEQVFTGGGVGFQGGSVGMTPITTLSQVLDLFPDITASQAADFLGEFSGILPDAALLQGFDVINISGDPSQPILDQPSSLGTTGISPEDLFKLLFPSIISNF